jgi:HK97 family phage major capsid protein
MQRTHLTLAQALNGIAGLSSSFHFNHTAELLAESRRFQQLANQLQTDPSGKPRESFSMTLADKVDMVNEVQLFARDGKQASTPTLRKFATITTGSEGMGPGVTMPTDFNIPIGLAPDNSFRAAHVLLGVKPIESALANDLNWPALDPTAGHVVAENEAEASEEGTIHGMKLNTRTYTSEAYWFSNLVINSGIDFTAWIMPYLAANCDLGFEKHITETLIADDSIQTVPASSVSTISIGSLQDLRSGLSRRFRRLRVILLGEAAYIAAQKMVGDDGHAILTPHPTIEGVSYFRGTLVIENDNLEAFGASKCIGACISLYGARIRDITVQNLARMTDADRPAQTGFELFQYKAFGYLPEAVCKLVTPAE